MGRVWLAGLCVVAGVGVLAGPGWALLAAAVVLYLTPVPERVRHLARKARAWTMGKSRATRRWLVTGRHQVAMAAMPVGVILVPVGAGMAFGAGWALIIAGALCVGVALLLGWDTRPAP